MAGTVNGESRFLRVGDLIRRGENSFILVVKLEKVEHSECFNPAATGLYFNADGKPEEKRFASFSCRSIIRDGTEYTWDAIVEFYRRREDQEREAWENERWRDGT